MRDLRTGGRGAAERPPNGPPRCWRVPRPAYRTARPRPPDGCDYNCSFCTIPMARGKSRSNSIENVLTEIDQIAASGVKEIVLTGINLGDFGKDETGYKTPEDFYSLLQAIEKHEGVERYRISSIEPNLLTDNILELVAASKKIMPHFHIPLQSGSNKILGMMRRRYKKDLYAEKIAFIKRLIA